MNVEAQLLAMNRDAQISTPVAVRGRQMTVKYQEEGAFVSTPLHYRGPHSGYQPTETSGQGHQTARKHSMGSSRYG